MARHALVRFDDWTVLYSDGRKVMENHSLDIRDVLEAVGADCEVKHPTDAYDIEVSEQGSTPDALADIPEGALL